MPKGASVNNEQQTTSTITEESKGFALTEEQKEFLKIAEITGKKFELNTDLGQRSFIVNFNQWVTAGKPKPELKIEQLAAPIPYKFYREKVRGKEKFYYATTDGKMTGKRVEKEPVERTDRDGNKFTVEKQVVHYDIDFTKETAEPIIKDGMDRAMHPHFYFVLHGRKVSINTPEEFFGDFDAKILPMPSAGGAARATVK